MNNAARQSAVALRRAAIRLPDAGTLFAVDRGAVDVPDIPVEPVCGGRYPVDMETRVAVLEQIARTTTAPLERIERRLDLMTAAATGTTLAAFLGVMAHGFHWP
jgi:hypothetical protein